MPDQSPIYSGSQVHFGAQEALLKIELRNLVSHYMEIHEEPDLAPSDLRAEDRAILARGGSELVMSFSGDLVQGSAVTFNELEKALGELDLYLLLRANPRGSNEGKPYTIHILANRPPKPDPLPVWPNVVLFIATFISVLLTGATIALAQMHYDALQANPAAALAAPQEEVSFMGSLGEVISNAWRGWPYALAILLILVPHEMGHYLMMRRHNAAATWPYFLPAFMISPFGTFGAAIMLRETLRSRKTLLDVGAAGPLAGFIMAVPVLFIGLATSQVIPVGDTGMVEGNSLLYAFAKRLVFGELLPSATRDVLVNQFAWAGWTGLFVTALNMLPLGQLDGGHVVYSLFGDRARMLFWPFLGVLITLALFVSPTWLFFSLVLLLVGRHHAVPLDNVTPPDGWRRAAGLLALLVFILSFTPVPIYERGASGGLLSGLGLAQILMVTTPALLLIWQRRYRQPYLDLS